MNVTLTPNVSVVPDVTDVVPAPVIVHWLFDIDPVPLPGVIGPKSGVLGPPSETRKNWFVERT